MDLKNGDTFRGEWTGNLRVYDSDTNDFHDPVTGERGIGIVNLNDYKQLEKGKPEVITTFDI